ncbi:hypothetical protein M427DRAFT_52523 [Gonapodya prolifera JEL478]|uniref:Uncharacterized protein n=1 Tax=Gonapodya prolifera (strain JEL478) TaxID=1344416 RepID=A0A139AUB3_GONPJ|nr:hypothetical protein M427DRAFT_52523 [Gonapodya prolifera JEL478]|eukprot:KXS20294.1 hypothetical protein M427DRAFT_52523 [Gonapodya prolifera JEL478]
MDNVEIALQVAARKPSTLSLWNHSVDLWLRYSLQLPIASEAHLINHFPTPTRRAFVEISPLFQSVFGGI